MLPIALALAFGVLALTHLMVTTAPFPLRAGAVLGFIIVLSGLLTIPFVDDLEQWLLGASACSGMSLLLHTGHAALEAWGDERRIKSLLAGNVRRRP